MNDPTESIRREMVQQINGSAPDERAEAEARYGQCWNTAELQAEFTVVGFLAPFVEVCRKSDGVQGTMKFQHSPRLYFCFEATNG